MDSRTIALLILAALIVGVVYTFFRLIKWQARRYYYNLFAGHLWEDYIRDHPDHVHGKDVTCCNCGSYKIVMRNLGRRSYEGSDVLREHVYNRCGQRLYLSATGEDLEGIIQEIRERAEKAKSAERTVPSK